MEELEGRWQQKADVLEPYAPTAAEAFRECADDLVRAIEERRDEILTIQQAAEIGGYSEGHLRRLVRDGKVPNAGQKGSPRIRRKHVPFKADGLRQDGDVIDLGAYRNEQIVRSVVNE